MILVVFDACEDNRLNPAAFRVYVWLTRRLDTMQFRPLKIVEVAHALRVTPRIAIHALRKLREFGYVEREASRGMGEAWRYRLYASPQRDRAA
jgi:DNA-binding GntR family transcriptional regulator